MTETGAMWTSATAALPTGVLRPEVAREVVQDFVRVSIDEAEIADSATERAARYADVADAWVWGLDDPASAGVPARDAVTLHPDSPRAWAALRRVARSASDAGELWDEQGACAANHDLRLMCGVGALLAQVASGRVDEAHLAGLRRALQDETTPAELLPVVATAVELASVVFGDLAGAVEARRVLIRAVRSPNAETDVESATALVGAIALARAAGDARSAVRFAREAFAWVRNEEVLRTLLRDLGDEGDWRRAAETLVTAIATLEDPASRSRWLAEAGWIHLARLDRRDDGLRLLAEGSERGPASPAIARMLLDCVAGAEGDVPVEILVDSMGLALDFASSDEERAELRADLADAFHDQLGLNEAAAELAREGLSHERPPVRLRRRMERLLTESENLDALGEFLHNEIERAQGPLERYERLLRLAGHHEAHGAALGEVESLLQKALQIHPSGLVARRLIHRLLRMARMDDAREIATRMAERVEGWLERASMLEIAATLSEATGQLDAALTVRQQLSAIDRGASARLGELRLHEWLENPLAAAEIEADWAGAADLDRASRTSLLARAATRLLDGGGDTRRAEALLREALDLDPSHIDALLAQERVLRRERRFADLAAALERAVLSAPTDQRRAELLHRVLDVYLQELRSAQRAAATWERILAMEGESETSLLGLERVAAALGDGVLLYDVLRRREARCGDEAAAARLAFRRALLDEYTLRKPGEAFAAYLAALGDPMCAPLAISALDRLARSAPSSLLRVASERLAELASTGPLLTAEQAAAVLAERFSSRLAPLDLEARIVERAERFPEDLGAVGWLARIRLRTGETAEALALLREVPRTLAEEVVHAWLDAESSGAELRAPIELAPEPLRTLLRVEFERDPEGAAFEGATLRSRWSMIGAGSASRARLCDVAAHRDTPREVTRVAFHTARVLRDVALEQEAGIAFARAAASPVQGIFRWLLVAATTGADEARMGAWLNEASALGAWDAPIRERLYEKMKRARAWDVLASAIASHLEHGSLSASAAGALAARRAEALEHVGRRDEAIAALAFALVRCPADFVSAQRKARLEARAERADAAVTTLEDVLDAGVTPEVRVELLMQLADLHWEREGHGASAVQALESAWNASGFSPRIARRLAHAHSLFGAPDRAAELLQDSLPTPAEEEDLEHWLRLTRLLAGPLEQGKRAETILWELLERFPQHRAILDELQEMHRAASTTATFVDHLGDLLAADRLAVDAAMRVALWHYVGEINHSVLRRFDAAESAFEHAARVDEPTPALLLRWASAISRQGDTRASRACELCVDAMRRAGDDEAVWRDALALMQRILQERRDTGRLRVVQQMMSTLFADAQPPEAERGFRAPQTTFDRAMAWEFLGAELVPPSAREVLAATSPLLDRALPRPPRPRDARRPRAEELVDFESFLGAACTWLGVTPPRIDVSEGAAQIVVVDGSHFVVPGRAASGGDALTARYWAGAVAALRFAGFAALHGARMEDVVEVLDAVAGRELGRDVRPSAAWEAIGGLLLALQRRRAAAALREHPDVLEPGSADWCADVSELMDRAGLLVSGDLATVVREITLQDGRGDETVLRSERVRRIALFALGPDHARLRQEAGLDGRLWLY